MWKWSLSSGRGMVCGLPTTQQHILSSVEPRHPKGTASGLSVEQLVIWIAFHFAKDESF